MENTKIRCMHSLKALVTCQCNGKLLQAMIPTIPQLGWEVYKEKQEVMPGITKGHFPFDWNEYFNGSRSAMRPGGGRGRQSVSQIQPITCGLTHRLQNLWNTRSDQEKFLFCAERLQNEVCITANFYFTLLHPQAKSLALLA